jgi:hypothetical protein
MVPTPIKPHRKAKAPVAVGEKPTATETKQSRSFLDYACSLFSGALVILFFRYKR